MYTTSPTTTDSPSCSMVESEVQKPNTQQDGYHDDSKYIFNFFFIIHQSFLYVSNYLYFYIKENINQIYFII